MNLTYEQLLAEAEAEAPAQEEDDFDQSWRSALLRIEQSIASMEGMLGLEPDA